MEGQQINQNFLKEKWGKGGGETQENLSFQIYVVSYPLALYIIW